MHIADPPFTNAAASNAGWRAHLELEYAQRDQAGRARTVLARRRHDGPLVVQKALYPEGDAVCHNIIVHPPAGIAGGDSLEVDVRVGEAAHALLTTPGAAKWYRSAGAWARQYNHFVVATGACLEYLPQETIVYDGALAQPDTEVQLAPGASYIGWDVLCLGRSGSGERFTRGQCHASVRVSRGGKPLWLERARIDAGGLLMQSAAGLSGNSVCGTLIAVTENPEALDLNACRAVTAKSGDTAVTRLPGLLVARYLGHSSEAAKSYFVALWQLLRPVLMGRPAIVPRIWNT